jgi:hypothetical protein
MIPCMFFHTKTQVWITRTYRHASTQTRARTNKYVHVYTVYLIFSKIVTEQKNRNGCEHLQRTAGGRRSRAYSKRLPTRCVCAACYGCKLLLYAYISMWSPGSKRRVQCSIIAIPIVCLHSVLRPHISISNVKRGKIHNTNL